MQLTAWAPVRGDALLAASWALWLHGLRNSGFRLTLASLSLGVTALLLGADHALGLAPQRGTGWLALELALALALAFAVAAQRAWARQDVNRHVPRA